MKHLSRPWWTWVLLLALGMLWMLPTSNAHADVSCQVVDAPNINFGTVDGLIATANDSASNNVSWNCSNTEFSTAYVTLCLNIGAGSGGTGGGGRVMSTTSGQDLAYQLYQDAAHQVIWGSLLSSANPNPLMRKFTVPAASITGFFNVTPGHATGNATLFGQILLGQMGVTAGSYSSAFSGNDAMFSGTYSTGFGTFPATCGSANAGSFSFTVSANVNKTCNVSADTLTFPATGVLDGVVDSTTTVHTQCTNGTSYQIGLDNGRNASGTRRMAGGGEFINYELYKDASRSTRWGNTYGADTVAATGNGAVQNVTVYGRVPAQTTPGAGTYSDTITVSVYY
ncbi:spore coat U domain-containing protein [Dyella sp.]|uniref:Csu type fimbrial protein n=1 Tax=Dyella sp. TaxID=1869338 RepID=UPI002ED5CF1E